MGINNSRVIQLDNKEAKLQRCHPIAQSECPIYGKVVEVQYQSQRFNMTYSQTGQQPRLDSVHYLIPSDILIFPNFTLFQDHCPESLEKLLDIIISISEVGAKQDRPFGIGKQRLAYFGRWGTVGERQDNWAYNQVLHQSDATGVYFSPQLMLSYSQRRQYPKHDPIKSDIFAFGLMLVEIIFGEELAQIYDYENYEIKLKPLLEKLSLIRNNFGEQVYEVFVRMLEIQEADRISYDQLYEEVFTIRRNMGSMKWSNNSHMADSSNSRPKTPTRSANNGYQTGNRTPRASDRSFRNDVSPLRARFAGNARVPQRLGRTPERQRFTQQVNQGYIQKGQPVQNMGTNRSPHKRELKINTRFNKENNFGAISDTYQRGMYSPMSRSPMRSGR